jgi:hypothetical protein
MRRVVSALAAALLFTFGMALPVASFGLASVTLTCDDGTSFSATVDADTLSGLTKAVEAMTLYPAGLSCTLNQALAFRALGGVASAWPGGGFIVGGGRFQAGGCPNGELFWLNFAVSAHTETADAGSTKGGTFNLTIPEGQCHAPGHLTSKPTCLKIDAEGTPPPQGAWYAYLTSLVTETSGSLDGIPPYIFSGWKDTGNPGKQLSPDREADYPSGSDRDCPPPESPSPDDQGISHPIADGNVTIHPAQ